MERKLMLLASAFIGHHFAVAQQMTLQGGNLTIAEGTRINLNGALLWTIAPGATVVNNGEIDLGAEATLNETLGAPITGTGIERSNTELPAAFTAVEPGGLGLTLSAGSGIGPVEVVRGHQPIVLPSGDQSVARWFAVDAPPQPGLELQLTFGYDPSELNGLEGSNLVLHTASSGTAPWVPLPSFPNAAAYEVGAIDQSPWALYTAFDADAETRVDDRLIPPFRAWPTVVDEAITIAALAEERIATLEVLDAAGRLLLDGSPRTAPGAQHRLDLQGLPAGALFLRINGLHVIKLIKA